MNMTNTIRKRTISLALAVLMAFGCMLNTPATSAVEVPPVSIPDLSLGAAQGYNLVCFGDFTNGSTDIQGKAFVGGAIKCSSGFQFGNSLADSDLSLVFGSVIQNDFQASSNTSHGKALVYQNFTTTENDTKINSHTFTGGIDKWSSTDDLKNKTGIDLAVNNGMTVFQKQMINKSAYVAGLTPTVEVTGAHSASGELLFTGTDDHLNIFQVNASVLNNYSKILLSTPSTSTDIVNVVCDNGNTNVKIPLVNYGSTGSNLDGQNGGTGQYKLTHLLWNLSTATAVSNYKDNSIKGSVLAPKAKFTGDGSNYEGTLIVDSFDVACSSHIEGHDYPFTTDLALSKTAALNSWNDRTYSINLTASSNVQKYDIVFVIDRSNSMMYGLTNSDPAVGPTNKELGTFSQISSSLDITKKYYYYNAKSELPQLVNAREDGSSVGWNGVANLNRLEFSNNEWQYCNRSSWYRTSGTPGYWIEQFTPVRPNSTSKIYCRNDRMCQIKDAADAFIDDTSSENRIAVVSFGGANDSKTWTELAGQDNGTNETSGTWSTDKNVSKTAVNKIRPLGGTQMNLGLNMAYDSYLKNDRSGNKKAVIALTDGEDNDGGSLATAAAARLKNNGIEIYTIGFALGSSTSNAANHLRKDIATDANHAFTAENASSLSGVFSQISNAMQNATVTDVIDPRFNVLNDSGNVISNKSGTTALTNGGTVSYDNSLHAWKVTWNTAIPPKHDNGTAGWSQTITVKAKDEFIGGNNIPTNVAASSGVTYGDNLFTPFPNQPTVNVKPVFQVDNDTATIFRGEEVPPSNLLQPYTLEADRTTKVTGQGMYILPSGSTGTFTYQWKNANLIQIADSLAFPSNKYANDDTHYTLTATFTPNSPTADSTANSGGNVAQSTDAQGTYTVNVVKGELDITKKMNQLYPAPTEVEAKQSFVFKIQRFENLADAQHSRNAAETFYEVITPNAVNTDSTKKITGLKKGYYKITEETDAWRYTQSGTPIDNDNFVSDIGIVFVGRETSANPKAYFGAQTGSTHVTANPATIRFTNTLTNNHWLGDTTVVVNNISQ